MSEVAAPPSLVFRRRRTLELLRLYPELELGAGGEARVYALAGDDALVAKLYHAPTMERARKLALMMEDPPELDAGAATLAWPCDLLLDRRGRFGGFLMPRAEGPRIFEFYNPVTRRGTAPLCDYGVLHRAGANLAAAFDALHARGYVVGDVNESNVLVGEQGVVTLVDADSFQVRDPDGGAVHRSHVGKPEFTPPELQGRAFAGFDRTPEHDRFGLAVLLFLLLMEGTHPFAGRLRGGAETPPLEDRIRRGLFPHHGHEEFLPPRMAPRFAVLHPALRALFVRAFVDGHADASARPAAAEWREALAAAEAQLAACEHNPLHRHGAHLDACPWCERTALLRGRDPFPAPRLPARVREGADAAGAASIFAGGRPPVLRGGSTPAPVPAAPVPAELALQASGSTVSVFATPLPWLAPLLCLAVFGGIPIVQTAAFFGFVYALTRALQRGLAGATGGEAVTASIFLFALAAVLAALIEIPGVPADRGAWTDDYPALVEPAPGPFDVDPSPAPALPAAPRVEIGQPFASNELDAHPSLLDAAEAEALLAENYPARLLRGGVDGGVTLYAVVHDDGTVDPASVSTASATHPELALAVAAVAPRLRFTRPTFRGLPTTAWVAVDLWFTP